ncbi:Barnase inhibitor [Rubrivivax sp. A210]|uniref:barstar family protein n=1 Tax=Rubrivivax sp. A210 TaxID=2772301 RepID=UPI001919F45C|nr:barstar family protein [Rubrivivax sp. A210]CAD5374677.1 Barnase inhibitor [Rubrivivax sp. A210]
MTHLTLPTQRISDWPSFHDECAKLFGFPEFYGRNMDAWIDCLTYLQDDDGMSTIKLTENEDLFIHVPQFTNFFSAATEVCTGLLECTAFVNQRYIEAGEKARIVLVLE